ncbi:MAG: 2-hydroxyacid dehydrogenase [Clostridia bacterium]|nr:2-hydroxyacid dehydrogenase [Clostridia bacterium]
MTKVALFDSKNYDLPGFEKYAPEKDIEIKYFEAKLCEDTAELAKGFDCVCVFVNDELDAATVEKLYSYGIRLIALRCAGFNNIDTRAAYKKIHIVRVPAYSPQAVAEHAMAMLLTSVRRIHKAYNRTRDFNFSLSGFTGFELKDKTVGVIGTGKIGMQFIEICRGFKMNVIAYDPFPNNKNGINYVSLDELFTSSDIISLHCPLTAETEKIINENSISKMKKGVIILNTSRGALINSAALIDGIKDKKIGAACLDVYEEESDIFFEDKSGHIMLDDNLARLLSMPNVLVTSHQAFLTEEALDSIACTTVNNINSFFKNGKCENEICYHCEKLGKCTKEREEKCF